LSKGVGVIVKEFVGFAVDISAGVITGVTVGVIVCSVAGVLFDVAVGILFIYVGVAATVGITLL
jgi:hypothetical protein